MDNPTTTKKRRRRSWPSVADAVRMETISVLMDIYVSVENAQAMVYRGDGLGVLAELSTIQNKARKGTTMLNRAKEL